MLPMSGVSLLLDADEFDNDNEVSVVADRATARVDAHYSYACGD
jgi:hypothetical protein